METYFGHIHGPEDAIKLFEACRLGLLPRVQRRLTGKERGQIRNGSVFVWDEREAGMRRWTDGRLWSASRVSGSFLNYREMESKGGRRKSSIGEVDHNSNPVNDEPEGDHYKVDGLFKQSFSITTSTGQHLHLMSYYLRPKPGMPDFPQPRFDPMLEKIIPQKGLYPTSATSGISRIPPRQHEFPRSVVSAFSVPAESSTIGPGKPHNDKKLPNFSALSMTPPYGSPGPRATDTLTRQHFASLSPDQQPTASMKPTNLIGNVWPTPSPDMAELSTTEKVGKPRSNQEAPYPSTTSLPTPPWPLGGCSMESHSTEHHSGFGISRYDNASGTAMFIRSDTPGRVSSTTGVTPLESSSRSPYAQSDLQQEILSICSRYDDVSRDSTLPAPVPIHSTNLWSPAISGDCQGPLEVPKENLDEVVDNRYLGFSLTDLMCRIMNARNGNISGQSAPCIMNIETEWMPTHFLKTQTGCSKGRIGSMVAITGSAMCAYATTVSNYAEETWPETGSAFIECLQNTIDNGMSTKPSFIFGKEIQDRTWDMILETSANQPFKAAIRGSVYQLAEFAQQIAWCSAALTVVRGDTVKYAMPNIQIKGVPGGKADQLVCRIRTELKMLPKSDNSCWLPLFENSVIAHGFPIPSRGTETGLEVPISLMAALSGAQQIAEYNGTVVLKGYSTMLVPVGLSKDNVVQWHLVCSADEDTRMTYQEGLSLCGKTVGTDQLGIESLGKTRAILGWCSSAEMNLGSPDADYANIDYSGAPEADSNFRLMNASVGFQQFGVGQLDFNLGSRNSKFHLKRDGPYRRIIGAAERTPVVLYDTMEGRGWLVPASGVILHIAQHRNCLDPFRFKGENARFQMAGSVRETLLQSASLELSDEEPYQFRDLVSNIWSTLEYLLDQKINQDQTPGRAVKLLFKDQISGFEYKAIVEERSPYRQKACNLRKTSGGWLSLVKDIDALVLFANGFGNVMNPRNDQDNEMLCHGWRSIPMWKDYLATSVKMMLDIYDVAGCRLDRKYLTSTKLRWHRGRSTLFESCPMPGSFYCQCNRLQQIVSESTLGAITDPGVLQEEGAVVFGAYEMISSALCRSKKSLKPQLYSQANVSLIPQQEAESTDSGSTSPTSDIFDARFASSSTTDTLSYLDNGPQELHIEGPPLGCTPNKKRPAKDNTASFRSASVDQVGKPQLANRSRTLVGCIRDKRDVDTTVRLLGSRMPKK